MSRQSRTLMIVLTGAALGGVAGYLLLTEDGRRLKARLEPAIGDLMREVTQLGATISSASLLVREGLQALSQMAGETERSSAWSAPLHQHEPF